MSAVLLVIAIVFASLAALLHIYIFVMESVSVAAAVDLAAIRGQVAG